MSAALEALRHRQDAAYKERPLPPLRSAEDVERTIRARERETVRYFRHGNAWKAGSPQALARMVRFARRLHTESVRRSAGRTAP